MAFISKQKTKPNTTLKSNLTAEINLNPKQNENPSEDWDLNITNIKNFTIEKFGDVDFKNSNSMIRKWNMDLSKFVSDQELEKMSKKILTNLGRNDLVNSNKQC